MPKVNYYRKLLNRVLKAKDSIIYIDIYRYIHAHK